VNKYNDSLHLLRFSAKRQIIY